MKKYIPRIIAFIVLFVLIFYLAQYVLHYRWATNDDLYTRNINYMKQPADSIDVLYFGTSETHAMCTPIITYAEKGITGYNFAISHRSAVTAYYQLLFALKHQNPKVVVCDFSSLYDPALPDTKNDPIYRKVVDCMPDKEIKSALLKDIRRLGDDRDFLSWIFPLFRYHGMWSELTEDDFLPDHVYNEDVYGFEKGALLSTQFENEVDGFSDYEVSEDYWDAERVDKTPAEISVEYYDKFIAECYSRGIFVVAVYTPTLRSAKDFTSRWESTREYLESRNVMILNYNNYEQYKRMGLVWEDDYYDMDHFNMNGAIKGSRILAEDLDNMFDLDDRRTDPEVAALWDKDYDDFVKYTEEFDKCSLYPEDE